MATTPCQRGPQLEAESVDGMHHRTKVTVPGPHAHERKYAAKLTLVSCLIYLLY